MLTATLLVIDEAERRGGDRRPVDRASTARADDRAPRDVQVLDLSRESIGFVSEASFVRGQRITIGLAGSGTVSARVVRKSGRNYGCTFDAPLSREQLAAAFSAPLAALDLPLGRAAELLATPGVTRWPAPVRLLVLVAGLILSWALVYLIYRLATFIGA
jgi:hypothetical protein